MVLGGRFSPVVTREQRAALFVGATHFRLMGCQNWVRRENIFTFLISAIDIFTGMSYLIINGGVGSVYSPRGGGAVIRRRSSFLTAII